MVWVRITLGFQPRVIRTQTINIFSYCMNKQGITNSIPHVWKYLLPCPHWIFCNSPAADGHQVWQVHSQSTAKVPGSNRGGGNYSTMTSKLHNFPWRILSSCAWSSLKYDKPTDLQADSKIVHFICWEWLRPAYYSLFEVMLGHFVQAGPFRTVRVLPLAKISCTNKQTLKLQHKSKGQIKGGGVVIIQPQNTTTLYNFPWRIHSPSEQGHQKDCV